MRPHDIITSSRRRGPARRRAQSVACWRPRAAWLLLLAVLVSGACVNRTEVNTARRSVYDADFARVYNAAVGAVRSQYARFDENPATGKITTDWQVVNFTSQADDPRSRSSNPTAGFGTNSGTSAVGSTDAMGTKRYYVKFDITVGGQRPWRVRVMGQAAEWRSGDAKATPLRGAAIPSWLPAREDALVVAIYRALTQFARPAPVELGARPPDEGEAVSADQFVGVPAAAATALAALKTAVLRRDYAAVEQLLAEDVVWSAGAAPGRTGAMVILRADPARLERLATALDAGCAGADAEVSCGVAGAPRVVLRPVGATWLVGVLE